MDKELEAELLLFKEQDWEEQIAPKMNKMTCQEVREVAYESNKIKIQKEFGPVS